MFSKILVSFLLLTPIIRAEEVGRYQIVSATVVNDSTGERIPMLFRLDTATGKASRFILTQTTNKDNRVATVVQGWVPVADDYNREVGSYRARAETDSANAANSELVGDFLDKVSKRPPTETPASK